MKTILVTGGAGYVGSHTVRRLIRSGFKVIVLDNLSFGHKESLTEGAILETADLNTKASIVAILNKYRPEAVIDFAASAVVTDSMNDPQAYLQNNIYNFLNLLEAMVETKTKFLIKSSTSSTYGEPRRESDFPLKEDYQKHHHFTKSALLEATYHGKLTRGEELFQYLIEDIQNHLPHDLKLSNCQITELRIPTSVYGLTKLTDEILMKKFNKKYHLSSIVLRYFNACGADDAGDIGEDHTPELALIPNVIWTALGQKDHFDLYGTDFPTHDGTAVRDFIHVNDLADGHILALQYLEHNQGFHIFNLGNGRGYSVREVIETAETIFGDKLNIVGHPRRSGDPSVSYADASKAMNYLDWKPKYDLSKIIRTAGDWHKSHPKGFAK